MDRAADNHIGVHGHPGYALLNVMRSETLLNIMRSETHIPSTIIPISLDLVHSTAAVGVISVDSHASALLNAIGMATAALTTMISALQTLQTILKAVSKIRRLLHLHRNLMTMRVTSAIVCTAITRPILRPATALKSLASM